MNHIIYLAAGQARRYGSNKLLAEYHGKPLYRHGLEAILTAVGRRTDTTVTVVSCWNEIEEVLLHEWDLIKMLKVHESFGNLHEIYTQNVDVVHELRSCWTNASETRRVVHCPDSHMGVSHSICAGILSIPLIREGDYLCFAVADQPALTAESVEKLLKNADGDTLTACLCADGNCGNPVLFHNKLIPELLALQGDRGGKSVMRSHPERHVDVPCEPVELRDIDMPETVDCD